MLLLNSPTLETTKLLQDITKCFKEVIKYLYLVPSSFQAMKLADFGSLIILLQVSRVSEVCQYILSRD